MTHAANPLLFLSFSQNDKDAAKIFSDELEKSGLSVLRDNTATRSNDNGLFNLQDRLKSCNSFVILLGRDIAQHNNAEIQLALARNLLSKTRSTMATYLYSTAARCQSTANTRITQAISIFSLATRPSGT